MSIMLDICNLTKKYGDKIAVDNLSLHIAPGTICGFIGRNGAGKTTTLKSCAGILGFDSGSITINGTDITAEAIKAKSVMSYIPDNPEIYSFMTGIKYLNFICDIFKIPVSQRDEKIHTLSDRFELTADLAKPVSQYSHGMKQKLALIGGFIHSPRLLLLDEPFVGLDPKAASTVKAMMHELCGDGGAVFFSTHVLEVAQSLCDEIAIIRDGKLIANGKTDEICGSESLTEAFFDLTEAPNGGAAE